MRTPLFKKNIITAKQKNVENSYELIRVAGMTKGTAELQGAARVVRGDMEIVIQVQNN